MLVPSPTAPKHTVAKNHRVRENSINTMSANFFARRTVWQNPDTWHLPYVYYCAKDSAGFPNSCWNHRIRLRKMHAVLLLFRPLPNVGIQNFGMWGMYNLAKANRGIQKSIAELRTGKPATIPLKIQLNCSTVRDMTVWANIFVCSHLGCGTDSVFILFCKSHKYFKDAKAMQINRILKISLIWHVKLNQPPKQQGP